MALPHSRYETFIANDVAGGSILMAIQDHAVAFFRKGRRKSTALILSPFGTRGSWPTFAPGASTQYVQSSAISQNHRIPLLLRHGDVVQSIVWRYYRGGGTNMAAGLYRYALNAASGPTAVIGATTLSGGPAIWTSTTSTGPHTIDQAYAYFLQVVSGQSGDHLSQIEINFTH